MGDVYGNLEVESSRMNESGTQVRESLKLLNKANNDPAQLIKKSKHLIKASEDSLSKAESQLAKAYSALARLQNDGTVFMVSRCNELRSCCLNSSA